MRIGVVSFLHVLTLIFVTAKLAGAVQWSWWLVALPSVAALGLVLLFSLVLWALFAAAELSKKK